MAPLAMLVIGLRAPSPQVDPDMLIPYLWSHAKGNTFAVDRPAKGVSFGWVIEYVLPYAV